MDKEVILSHALSFETGMPASRLMGLTDTDQGLMVQVRLKGLPNQEDTAQQTAHVFEDVPQLLIRLLKRKNVPKDLVKKAHAALSL